MNTNLVLKIKEAFISQFGKKPITIFSPGRINLIGEHTDYNEGFVFPAAIDKGIVAAVRKSKKDYCHVIATDIGESHTFLLDNIKPIENGDWRNYVIGVVAEIQKAGKKLKPFNLVFGGDIPLGSGLSSSAALENSVVFALNELFKLNLSKLEMIQISQKAEHNFAGVMCGIMDQYTSMLGQENTALLLDCRTQQAIPYTIDFNDYELLLTNTNVSHNLAAAEYNDRRKVCEKVARLLNIKALRDATEDSLNEIKDKISEGDYQKALYIIQENNRVLMSVKFLENNDLASFGKLLFEAHKGARNQFKISCDELDFLVDETKKYPEILGARMMGGGFGGCVISIIHKDFVAKFKTKIAKVYLEEFDKNCSFYHVKLSNGTRNISNVIQTIA